MFKKYSPPEKWILLGIPILFLVGSMFHFLYEISGENLIIGTFAPVNESIWEHLKLVVLPIICWWGIYDLTEGKNYNINKNPWFTGAIIALITALITIPLGYYFYTGAFGIELLAIDIALLLIAIFIGQVIGLHIYRHSNGIPVRLSILVMLGILVVFIIFTFNPPHLPMFLDTIGNQYGVIKY